MTNVGSTLAVIGGVLFMVGGIALAFVTGFDLFFMVLDLLLVGGGVGLIWKYHRVATPERQEGLTGERSVQRPMTSAEKNRARLKEKL